MGRKKSKRARKNSGEEKSRTRERAPGDKVLTDQFQTAGTALAFPVYLHEMYVQASCSPYLSGLFAEEKKK